MQYTDPVSIARSYWQAECRRDTAAVLSHYAEDGEFTYPGGTLVGHEQIARYYDDNGAKFPGLEVEIIHSVVDGDEAAIEWDAVMIDGQGGRHSLNGVNVIRVADGRFRTVHAYFDPASLAETTS